MSDSSELHTALRDRAGSLCELCSAADAGQVFADLLGQLYLDDETLAWAHAGLGGGAAAGEGARPTLDSNGVVLLDGDSVTLIKDLEVKGAGFTAKRGTLVKSIRLTDDPELADARVNKIAIVLKTCFLKKVS